jgi:hypothetical protein
MKNGEMGVGSYETRKAFRNVAVPEAGAPMVDFVADGTKGVRSEVAELLDASGTCGRCCGGSAT